MICMKCGRVTDQAEHLCTARATLSDLWPSQADDEWYDSAEGRADAADQARWDRRNK